MKSIANIHFSELRESSEFALTFRVRETPVLNPQKCLILLHGVGGSESNLSDFSAEIDHDTLVIFPRGSLQLGEGQFAWFRVAFGEQGPRIVESEAEQSRQKLIQFITQIQSAFQIAPAHTVIAGFSQGGIMSASVGLSAPESVSGFAVLSGRILPELEPHLADVPRLSKLQAFLAHGEHDTKLPVTWLHRADQLLTKLAVSHQTHVYPIEHGISDEMRSDFIRWLSGIASIAQKR